MSFCAISYTILIKAPVIPKTLNNGTSGSLVKHSTLKGKHWLFLKYQKAIIPSLGALLKIDFCQISSLIKYRQEKMSFFGGWASSNTVSCSIQLGDVHGGQSSQPEKIKGDNFRDIIIVRDKCSRKHSFICCVFSILYINLYCYTH